MRSKRRNKVSIIAQTVASFPSCSRMLQMAIQNKQRKHRNCDTVYLKHLCQCVLLYCSVENLKVGTWIRKKRSFLFGDCNHKEFGATVMGDSFEAIVSTLWCPMSSGQQKSTHETRYPEFVVVCGIKVEQRCNLPEPNVERHSSFGNQHAGTIYFQMILEQTRC